MTIVARKTSTYQLPPEGTYTATLIAVTDEGVRQNPFKPGKDQHRIKLVFRLTLPDGSTVELYVWVTLSVHEKATLYEIVHALTGGIPADDVDVESLIGLACVLDVEHYTNRTGQPRARACGYRPCPADAKSQGARGRRK
jgi:hypothetical protein